MKPVVPNDEHLSTWITLLLTDKSFQYALYRELRDNYLRQPGGAGLLFTYVHWLQQIRQDWQFALDEIQHSTDRKHAYSALIDNWDTTVPTIVLQSLDIHADELEEMMGDHHGLVGQRMHSLVIDTRRRFGHLESIIGISPGHHPETPTTLDDDHHSPGMVDLFYS